MSSRSSSSVMSNVSGSNMAQKRYRRRDVKTSNSKRNKKKKQNTSRRRKKTTVQSTMKYRPSSSVFSDLSSSSISLPRMILSRRSSAKSASSSFSSSSLFDDEEDDDDIPIVSIVPNQLNIERVETWKGSGVYVPNLYDRVQRFWKYIRARDSANHEHNKVYPTAVSIISAKRDCVVDTSHYTNRVNHFLNLISMIGSSSANGETWRACADTRPYSCAQGDGLILALKKMPIRIPTPFSRDPDSKPKKVTTDHTGESYIETFDATPTSTIVASRSTASTSASSSSSSSSVRRRPYHTRSAMQHEIWVEIIGLEVCLEGLLQSMCPNLPFLYDFTYCDNCTYENPALERETQKCLLVANELASGDYKTWLKLERRSILEFMISTFDIMSGLCYLWTMTGCVHRDLHPGNILVLGSSRSKHSILGYRHLRIRLPELDGRPFDAKKKSRKTMRKTTMTPISAESDMFKPGDIIDFYRPDLGEQFIIWDLQFMFRPKVFDAKAHAELHRSKPEYNGLSMQTSDYGTLFNPDVMEAEDVPKEHGLDPLCKTFLSNVFGLAHRNVPIAYAMLNLFRMWMEKPPSDAPIIESCDMTQIIKPSKELCQLGIFLPAQVDMTCSHYSKPFHPSFTSVDP